MNGIKSQISVIVPVYNVEQFLPKCLDSIIGQTYPNLQIILVDDGSTDGCGEICDEYARKDNRIKVIHQENSGTVKARNSGISLATGDYLAFVDADDYLPFDAYQELSAAIESENYDIVWYDVNIIGYDVYCISPNACKDSKNMLAAFLKNRKCSISGSQCSKIIKKIL